MHNLIQVISMHIKKYTISLPIKTVSESNSTEHWTKKAARHKLQKWLVTQSFRSQHIKVNLPVQVTLTRIAPKNLDEHDNLRVSNKWIVDSISENLLNDFRPGRADDCKEITWKYDQKKGKVKEYAVEVVIEEI